MFHTSKPSLSYNESLQIKPAPAPDIFHMLSTTQQQNPKVMIRNTLSNIELLKKNSADQTQGQHAQIYHSKNDMDSYIHTRHQSPIKYHTRTHTVTNDRQQISLTSVVERYQVIKQNQVMRRLITCNVGSNNHEVDVFLTYCIWLDVQFNFYNESLISYPTTPLL